MRKDIALDTFFVQVNGGAEKLLDSAERYSLYLAMAANDSEYREVQQRENIGMCTETLSCTCYCNSPFLYLFLSISFSLLLPTTFFILLPLPFLSSYPYNTVIGVTRYSPSSDTSVVFPESSADLENTTYAGSITAQITIPASLLAERQEGGGRYSM